MALGLGISLSQASAQEADVLWRAQDFCSRATTHMWPATCPDGPWDVTACVAGTAARPTLVDLLNGTGRFEVRQGDQGASSGGDRCEIVQQTRPVTGMAAAPNQVGTAGGEIRFFAFEALYDPTMQRPSRRQYQTVGQWHHSTALANCPASSVLRTTIVGPTNAKRLEVHAQPCVAGRPGPRRILLTTPLRTGAWQRWMFEIKWSATPGVGYIRLWHDGALVKPRSCAADGRCFQATLFSDAGGRVSLNHFKIGNYRDTSITTPTVVSFRNVRIGLSAAI